MRGEETGKRGGVFDGGGKADAAEIGGEGLQAGEQQGELVTAFGFGEGVQFVDDDALQVLEYLCGIFVA